MIKKLSLIFTVFFLLSASLLQAQNNIRYASGIGSYSSNYGQGWDPTAIFGEPTLYPRYGDIAGTFAFQFSEMGQQFITVSFSDPIQISSVAVYETSGTGAIDSIFISQNGEWELIYSNTPKFAGSFSRKLVTNFELTEFAVDSVKFTVNTNATADWEEYDAVVVADFDLSVSDEEVLAMERFEYEGFPESWTFVQNQSVNFWTFGQDPTDGMNRTAGAFISQPETGFGYNSEIESYAYFYTDITFPSSKSKFVIEFDWSNVGESGYDYLTVHLTDTVNTPNLESEFSTDQIGESAYVNNYTMKHETIIFGDELSGTTKRLIFKWRNDGSVGASPAFIDNIKVTGYDGSQVTGTIDAGDNYIYENLDEALSKIYAKGIGSGGAEIRMEGGIYTRMIDMNRPISGISSENQLIITSDGGQESVEFQNFGYYTNAEFYSYSRRSNQNWIIRLLDQDYITISNIKFNSYASPSEEGPNPEFNNKYARSIFISNSKNITIENNEFYADYDSNDPKPYYSGAIVLDFDTDGSNGIEEYQQGGGETFAVRQKSESKKTSYGGKESRKVNAVQLSNYNIVINNNYFENVGAALYGERRNDVLEIPSEARIGNTSISKLSSEGSVDYETTIAELAQFTNNSVNNSYIGAFLTKATDVIVSINSINHTVHQESAIGLLSVNNSLDISRNKLTGIFNSGILVNSFATESSNAGKISNNILDGDFTSEALKVNDSPELNVYYNTIRTWSESDTTAVWLTDVKSFDGNVVITDSSKTVRLNNVTSFDYNNLYQYFDAETNHTLFSLDGAEYLSLVDYGVENYNTNLDFFGLNGVNTETYELTTPNNSFKIVPLYEGDVDYFNVSRDPSETMMGAVEVSETVPVELASFTAQITDNGVILNWVTASETNNSGWEVERRTLRQAQGDNSSNNSGHAELVEAWSGIGFVSGKGTTTEKQSYQFMDSKPSGKVDYRLKQVNSDGSYAYSAILSVSATPETFSLEQNYPNPFNPNTAISYQLSAVSRVKLVVFDLLGREVVTLVNEEKPIGRYTANFNASHLTSGVYFYKLTVGSFTQTKKMMLMK